MLLIPAKRRLLGAPDPVEVSAESVAAEKGSREGEGPSVSCSGGGCREVMRDI